MGHIPSQVCAQDHTLLQQLSLYHLQFGMQNHPMWLVEVSCQASELGEVTITLQSLNLQPTVQSSLQMCTSQPTLRHIPSEVCAQDHNFLQHVPFVRKT